jgi:hypothetical protein
LDTLMAETFLADETDGILTHLAAGIPHFPIWMRRKDR